MQKFGRGVVKLRVPILIVSVLLLIPSIFGFLSTRINYDILSYLPSDIETMKGQDIMLDEFGKGGFSLVMLDGMEDKDLETDTVIMAIGHSARDTVEMLSPLCSYVTPCTNLFATISLVSLHSSLTSPPKLSIFFLMFLTTISSLSVPICGFDEYKISSGAPAS